MRPREVILKVSSKVLPNEDCWDLVPYTLPNVTGPDQGKSEPSPKGYKFATAPKRLGNVYCYLGVLGLVIVIVPAMMPLRSWSISDASWALTRPARSWYGAMSTPPFSSVPT